MKTTKIEIGTTFPFFYGDRWVNAEVDRRRKDGKWWWWTIRLTEGGRPIVRQDGPLKGHAVEWESQTQDVRWWVDRSHDGATLSPRCGSSVVQYVCFNCPVGKGLWAEIREHHSSGPYRPTRWVRSEYDTVEELIASGDAVAVAS